MEGVSTYLQIDLQNLFTGHGQKVDLEKVWEHFNDRDSEFLVGASVYTVRGTDFDSSKFETKIKAIGYDLVTKNLSKSGRKFRDYSPVNLDIMITVDCLEKLSKFDKWILMSNNGAFTDLCRYLKSMGKKIEVWGFRDGYDPNFELHADKVHFIDDDFCLKKPSVSVFGINWGLEKLDSTAIWGTT